jgi:4-hydroxy-tetrahydrodipicolinate synthase
MTGVIAAVATPAAANGGLNVATFERLVDFLIESGVDGLCLGGATSEYPNVPIADRHVAISAAARRLPFDRALLVAIGAPSFRQVLELGESARDAGSRAVLLPMPMFFRYDQHDLEAFSIEVSRTLRAPTLLYDLPDFTNALEPATVIRLLGNEEFLVGIKDSSGNVENLASYGTARDHCCLPFIGPGRAATVLAPLICRHFWTKRFCGSTRCRLHGEFVSGSNRADSTWGRCRCR